MAWPPSPASGSGDYPFWQVIDISFGVLGAVPLLLAYRGIRRLERDGAAGPAAMSVESGQT